MIQIEPNLTPLLLQRFDRLSIVIFNRKITLVCLEERQKFQTDLVKYLSSEIQYPCFDATCWDYGSYEQHFGRKNTE